MSNLLSVCRLYTRRNFHTLQISISISQNPSRRIPFPNGFPQNHPTAFAFVIALTGESGLIFVAGSVKLTYNYRMIVIELLFGFGLFRILWFSFSDET